MEACVAMFVLAETRGWVDSVIDCVSPSEWRLLWRASDEPWWDNNGDVLCRNVSLEAGAKALKSNAAGGGILSASRWSKDVSAEVEGLGGEVMQYFAPHVVTVHRGVWFEIDDGKKLKAAHAVTLEGQGCPKEPDKYLEAVLTSRSISILHNCLASLGRKLETGVFYSG